MTTIKGTTGDDTISGTSGNDSFNMTQGGTDHVSGLAGNDLANFGAVFNSNDTFDGGAGSDTLKLDGDYSGAKELIFGFNSLTSVETVLLTAGHSYTLVTGDGTVAAGKEIIFDGSALGANDVMDIQGQTEQDGILEEKGGAAADTLVGGQFNDKLFGGAGDDFLAGVGGQDVLDSGDGNDAISIGGMARVTAGAGSDLIGMIGTWNNWDRIDGGTGTDSLTIQHGGTEKFSSVSLTSIEQLYLNAASGDVTVEMNDANVAAGQQMIVSAGFLGAGQSFTFNGIRETDGYFDVIGGGGNDLIYGSANGDTIDPGAGTDRVNGEGGSNLVDMGANLDTTDRINGGAGGNRIDLNGDYSAGVNFEASTVVNFSSMTLEGGHSYKLIASDGTVAAGAHMTIDASALSGSDVANYNGSLETNGHYDFIGGSGTSGFTGGALSDTVLFGNSNTASPVGIDNFAGGGGDDVATITNAFDIHSKINGGDGNDTVSFEVSTSGQFAFTTATLTDVETLNIVNVTATSIAVRDQAVAAGETLAVNGSSLSGAIGGVTNHFTFDGSHETDGNFIMIGGHGNDTLIGGAGADSFAGGLGADTITGGAGADVFVYTAVAESASVFTDNITGFDALADKFDLPFAVTGIDAGVNGAASADSLSSDLQNAIGSGQLALGHALVFTATGGTLAGDTFLIVDANGTAGFQFSADMLFQLTGAQHLANLSTADFM
ncbi:MAG TPA: hypothetical protein VGF56_08940 [Rhizomicrobium sp.]|jgi:Ca2+-binding RTX toxin-like protein